MPRVLDRANIYAADAAGDLSPRVRSYPALVYVPNSQSNTVYVIDQRTYRVVRRFATGALPQHVTPSWDLLRLWVLNDGGNSLTPVDPRTGRQGIEDTSRRSVGRDVVGRVVAVPREAVRGE